MSKILLDPVDFDALHLSFLEHGGVGGVCAFSGEPAAPHCVLGHAAWLEGSDRATTDAAMQTEMGKRLTSAGLTWQLNDDVVLRARREGNWQSERIPFELYISLLNIDVKE